MSWYSIYGLVLFLLLLGEGSALACGTCSLDQGSVGQTLMLVSMLAIPLFVGLIGVIVIRRYLRPTEDASECP